MAETKSSRKETEAYTQALELVTALHQANTRELDDDTRTWLKSESEITSPDEERAFDLLRGAICEGAFKTVRSGDEIGPEPLWNRAQKKVQDEAARQDKKKPRKTKAREVALLHQRLLRVYWMVRLAAEELILHNPRTRLGKVLLNVEKNFREAFVETDEGIKLPLAMLRKKQWELLADYGMGLTVDEIYDLHPPRQVIEIAGVKALLVGILLGAIVGFIIALFLLQPPTP